MTGTSQTALDSKLKLTRTSSGAYIDVGPTGFGDRVHYASSEPWSTPGEHIVTHASGDQRLSLPNASADDTFRAKNVTMKVTLSHHPRLG